MHADLTDPLDHLRLRLVIDNLAALSERVTEAGEISAADVELLAESVDHLKDYRPSKN
ncbi:hypothetical protein ACP6NG_06680 [Brevibacterium casei]|uniref:Uncharacterized protein n=1 Tax=Brevibacterium casei TaxID=33889 RepID=A0A449CYU3_9MICO|nr:hypothetical protein [Brevibacterium casei]VEW10352.1 Uncharacterised protein [Brevibacterium casei]